MRNTCALPTLWVNLALAATLLAIWFRGSTALAKIAASGNCERPLRPLPPASKKSAQEVLRPNSAGRA
jgi:hypothetical protein